MAEQAAPPAPDAGIKPEANTPAIDLTAINQSVTDLQATIAEMQKNQKVLADTIAAQKPVDPAGVQAKAEAAALAAVKAKQDADAADAAKAQSRKELIGRIAAAKLGGDADFAAMLTGDDEAALNVSADKLAAKLKAIKPDFGGAAKDGGTPPAGAGGKGKYDWIKMPTSA